jgi:hypothetical protein
MTHDLNTKFQADAEKERRQRRLVTMVLVVLVVVGLIVVAWTMIGMTNYHHP